MISREQLQARCLHGILVLAMGLAACNLLPDKSELLDADSDGFAFDVDCDDADPAINPDAPDMVDDEGSDVNCDGLDGADADGDGVASEVSGGEDCDDRDPLVNSNVTESCDALDNDCDGVTDEDDASDALLWYADLDGDGYGDASVTVSSCSQPDGHVATSGDCDDSASAVNPGVEESCDNSVDDDCDASTDEGCSGPGTDDDGDGYTEDDGDCDDMDPDRSPGATETCFDDVDQDCSGAADDACMHVYTTSISMAPDAGTSTYYVDYPTEADETLAFLAVGSLIEYGDEQCDFQTDITDEGGRYRVEITLQHCGYGVYSSYGFQAQAVVFARVGGAGGFTAFDLESVGNLTDDGSATITDGDGTASTTLCAVYSGDAGGDVDAQWLCRANVEGDSLVGLLSQEYGNSASLAGARIMNIGLGENLEATAMPFSCGIEGDETYTHTVSEALGTDHLAIPVLTDWLTGTSDSTSMESDCDLVDDEYSCEIRCYGSGGSVGGTILFIDGSFQ